MVKIVSNSVKAKSIWISDTHLGSCGTQKDRLYDFLRNLTCDNLYLNGDIIDKWLLKKNDVYTSLIQDFICILKEIQSRGTTIVFLSGNHDCLKVLHTYFSDFKCVEELSYKSEKNKNYLVFHGDKLDYSVQLRTKTIAWFGTQVYETILKFSKQKSKPSKIGKWLKLITKNCLYFIFCYKRCLFNYLLVNNYDGVICGHSHQPKISKLYSKDYFNSGDWIDNCTFLIESFEGEFKLFTWEMSNS